MRVSILCQSTDMDFTAQLGKGRASETLRRNLVRGMRVSILCQSTDMDFTAQARYRQWSRIALSLAAQGYVGW